MNNWEQITGVSPYAPNGMANTMPYPFPVPQNGVTDDTSKALAMKKYITDSGLTPDDIDVVAKAKKAGVDVLSVLKNAMPKDARDERIDRIEEQLLKLTESIRTMCEREKGNTKSIVSKN